MLFAVNNVDLMVGPVKIQPQWIQNINTVCIVLGGPVLAAGKRRVCCFDRSGFYSKSLSVPKAAT